MYTRHVLFDFIPVGIIAFVVDEQGNIYVTGALPPHVQKFRQP